MAQLGIAANLITAIPAYDYGHLQIVSVQRACGDRLSNYSGN